MIAFFSPDDPSNKDFESKGVILGNLAADAPIPQAIHALSGSIFDQIRNAEKG